MCGANVKYFGRQKDDTLLEEIVGKKSAMPLAVFDFSCSLVVRNWEKALLRRDQSCGDVSKISKRQQAIVEGASSRQGEVQQT